MDNLYTTKDRFGAFSETELIILLDGLNGIHLPSKTNSRLIFEIGDALNEKRRLFRHGGERYAVVERRGRHPEAR